MSLLLLSRRPPLPLLLRLRTPLSLGLGLSTFFFATSTSNPNSPLLLDSSSASTPLPPPKVPVFKNGRVNPDAYPQISAGSILGVLGGVAVSTFSKTLAALFGLLVFGVQYAASKGYGLPTGRIQRYIKGFDLRSALRDNAAFKLSFGLTFMLAAFAQF